MDAPNSNGRAGPKAVVVVAANAVVSVALAGATVPALPATKPTKKADNMDHGRAFKIAGLSFSLLAVGVGASGCKLLKMAAKTQKHAAIAFDEKTGGWGYSYDQLTEDLAKSAATAKCPTCTVRLSWNQGCGALAQSTTRKDVMSTSLGVNRAAAEGGARSDCVSKGAGACNILIYACNSTN